MKRKIFLFLAIFMLIPAFIFSASKGDILITEFTPSGSPDYVEIQNVSGGPINVNGWIITDMDGTDTPFVSSNATLADGDIAVIRWTTGTSETDASGDSNSNGYWDFYCSDTALSSTDDQAVLKDAGGNIIDAVDWTNNDGSRASGETSDAQTLVSDGQWTGAGGQADSVVYGSIAERNNTTDTDSKNDWTGNTSGSLGVGNIGYVPGGDTTPPQVSSTTPTNGASGIGIGQDIVINFDEEMDSTSSSGITFSPDPGGQIYTWSNNTSTLTISHNNFAYNTSYTVTCSAATVKDVAGNQLDGNKDGTGGDDYAFSFTTGNYGDGSGTADIYPSKVLQNNYQSINVIYTAEVSMSGNTVSFTIPNSGTDWTAPQNGTPSAAGYVTVQGVGNTVNVSINSVNSVSGEVIVSATNLDTNSQFIFTYGDTTQGGNGAQCITTGNYTFIVKSQGNGSLTPITNSPSLDVYAPQGEKILISAIMVDSTPGYEYVELYNPGPNDIDLTNYWWAYYSTSKTDWTDPYRVKQFNDSGATVNTLIIPSCGYYLIAFNDDSNVLNYDAQYYTSTQLGNSQGAVAIYPQDPRNYADSSTAYSNRFDAIGWGPEALYEGTATSAPATDNEARRKSDASGIIAGKGNGYDTDDNSNDFVEQAGSPKNSTSSKECPPWDYVPPTITSTNPLDNSVNINTNTTIVVNFSEEMNTSSVMLALEVSPTFNYTYVWSNGNATLTLTPSTPLSDDTLYQVGIRDIAVDLAGNSLDGDSDGNPGGNYTFSFNTVDNVAPATINDLIAKSYPKVGGIKITFTAPGDNGTTGTCESYEIAYSTAPITNDADFIAAHKYDTSGITPQSAGNTESIILTLLPAGTTFYISAKGVDESNNKSAFGNVSSAVSGNFGVSKTPNIPLCEKGHGDLSLTYSVGSTVFDGNDSMYIIVDSSFTQPNTANLSILIDGTAISPSNYSINGSTITIPNITATTDIVINFNGYDFPDISGEYKFGMKINENNNDLINVDTPSFYVEKPATMELDPNDDPHSAPGHAQNIVITIKNSSDIVLYGAHITGMIIDSPIGATLSSNAIDTDITGTATFILNLAQSAGKHIVEFKCNDLTEYFTDTSFAGNFLSTPYPNPARNNVNTITFEVNIQEATHISLTILTMDARKVIDIADEDLSAGYHKITYNLKDRSNRKIPSGIYFAILKADKFTKMVKFTVMR